ncbi:MAG: PIG-L deacetylase family protein, partial [Chthoniobacterales bacterium]
MADSLEQTADIFAPSGGDWRDALRSATHLGIGAHADDLEFMAFHGIEACRKGGGKFAGVVLTDGAGSVGGGTDLCEMRRAEQREAAKLGGYAAVIQLGLTSAQLKDGKDDTARVLLGEIFHHAQPRTVYAHNPADRHDTHAAACLRTIDALRTLPADRRPQHLYGCELWRDLDWLSGDD